MFHEGAWTDGSVLVGFAFSLFFFHRETLGEVVGAQSVLGLVYSPRYAVIAPSRADQVERPAHFSGQSVHATRSRIRPVRPSTAEPSRLIEAEYLRRRRLGAFVTSTRSDSLPVA